MNKNINKYQKVSLNQVLALSNFFSPQSTTLYSWYTSQTRSLKAVPLPWLNCKSSAFKLMSMSYESTSIKSSEVLFVIS